MSQEFLDPETGISERFYHVAVERARNIEGITKFRLERGILPPEEASSEPVPSEAEGQADN